MLSAFPTFDIRTSDESDLGYLSYGGMMGGDLEKLYGKWNSQLSMNGQASAMKINDGLTGGPLVLFKPSGDTLIVSQMSKFMSTSMQYEKYTGYLSYGIMGGVDTVPQNFSADFLVYYSANGINKVFYIVFYNIFNRKKKLFRIFPKAMEEWGSILLNYYGKNLSLKENDVTINYLGYYTDNGGYDWKTFKNYYK